MSKRISGAGGGGGKGGSTTGSAARAPVEARDSLRSKQFARVLDVLCEGEIEGLADAVYPAKCVYLDGTPIQNDDGSLNFSGFEFSTRTGTQGQAYIAGIPSVESTTNVGVEVSTAVSVTRQITNANVDAMRVTVGIPQLSNQNTTTGDINGTSVQIAIDLQSNGGGFNQIILDTISGKASTRYQRSYRIPLTGSPPWDVRIRRITADSGSASLQNKTWWDTYTEVIEAKLRYPNSALVGMKIDSSQFNSIPTRGYDVKLLRVKVPSNYNPLTRVYTGAWDGTFQIAWTDNPAWCFYDLVTNDRYGLGGIVDEAQVDKWAMYQIGKYCDELVDDGFGGTEPRFTCNMYLQTRAEAYKVLQDFASIFRGMVYWSTGTVTAVQDAPADPVALYSAANVIDGKFSYQGSSLKARHTVALVAWNDPDDLYRQKVEYVEDEEGIARYGVQQTEIVAAGCTSRGQANRVGRWLLYSERFETETVTFSVGLDGAVVRPGHIIKVADANRANARLGGRVSTATTTAITLDVAPALGAGTWTLFAMLADGAVEAKTVASVVGNVVTVSSAFTSAPQPQSMWVLSGSSVEAQTFRVVSVAEGDADGTYSIAALKHEPLKYDAIENGLVLEPRDYTLLNDVPATPTGITFTESLYTYQAAVLSKISVGWLPVAGAFRYVVEWRKDSGNWTRVETQAADYELLDTTPGAYEFKVYAKNPAGLLSGALTGSLTALGKTAPPANVTGFSHVVDATIGATLLWSRVADLDLDAYEIRTGASWAAGTLVAQVKATQLKIGLMPAGSVTYWINALDTTGNYSASAASTTVTISTAAAPTVAASFVGENALLTWNAVQGTLATVEYEIRHGASYAGGTLVGRVKGTVLQTRANWSGARTFWVAALDANGNTGTAGSVVATVNAAPAPTVMGQFVGENIILTWGAVQGTVPTESYEIRYGASFAAGTSLGTIKGTSFSTKAAWAGVRRFWVAAIDINGTTGAVGNLDATVTVPAAAAIQQEVIDNNVLLRWGDATQTLPIDFYELRRGATWAGATVIGRVSARFVAIFESAAGTYTYRIRGYDVAGNEGAESVVSAYVSQPPDYNLQYDYNSPFGGTKTNVAADADGSFDAPLNTTETWATHFTSRGWTTPQDQINAGYPIYAMPSAATGSYEETIDYGTTLAATKITATLTYQAVYGTVTVTPTISVKKLVGDPWIDYPGLSSVYVTDFRYAKVRFDFASAGGDDLITISGLNVRFDVKLKNDAGTVAAVSTDSGGTTVNFTVPFVDVQSITLSPKGTGARIAVYDFVDSPNPTSFKVLLFDTAGNRISGDVGWSVKGV